MADEVTTYRVRVTREGKHWLADVPDLPGTQTYAPSLTALDSYVREAIALMDDLPDEAMAGLELDYSYDVADEAVAEAKKLREEREELNEREQRLHKAMAEVVGKLVDLGYSVRDAGPLLGVSHQRISQLRPGTGARPADASGRLIDAASAKSGVGKKAAAKRRASKTTAVKKVAAEKKVTSTPAGPAPVKKTAAKKAPARKAAASSSPRSGLVSRSDSRSGEHVGRTGSGERMHEGGRNVRNRKTVKKAAPGAPKKS